MKKYDYRTYTPITGYEVGLKDTNIYIGIPEKQFVKHKGKVRVKFGREIKTFTATDIVGKNKFRDKFIPNAFYLLYYVLWEKRDAIVK